MPQMAKEETHSFLIGMEASLRAIATRYSLSLVFTLLSTSNTPKSGHHNEKLQMLFITSLMVKAVIGISLRTTEGSSADIRTLVIKTDFSEGVLESTNQLSWRTQQRSLNPPLCHQRLIYQRWRRPRRLVDLRGEIFRQERTFRQTSFRMAQINGFTGVSSFGRLLIVYRRTGIQLDLLCQRKQARNGTSKFNGNLPIKPPWR